MVPHFQSTDICVTGRPCGSVAQWSECSHGMREVLGSKLPPPPTPPSPEDCCTLHIQQTDKAHASTSLHPNTNYSQLQVFGFSSGDCSVELTSPSHLSFKTYTLLNVRCLDTPILHCLRHNICFCRRHNILDRFCFGLRLLQAPN